MRAVLLTVVAWSTDGETLVAKFANEQRKLPFRAMILDGLRRQVPSSAYYTYHRLQKWSLTSPESALPPSGIKVSKCFELSMYGRPER